MKLATTLSAGALAATFALTALPAGAQPRIHVQFGGGPVAPPVYVAPAAPANAYVDPVTGRDPYRFAQRMRMRADQSVQRIAWNVQQGQAAPWAMRRAQRQRANLEAHLNRIVADGVITQSEAQFARGQVMRLENMSQNQAIGGGPYASPYHDNWR